MRKGMKTRVKYQVGDVIRVRCLDDIVRRVVVTSKETFDGWAGFNGYFPHNGELFWGFDLMIESVVKKEGSRGSV